MCVLAFNFILAMIIISVLEKVNFVQVSMKYERRQRLMSKKIVILNGSPRKKGKTAMLVKAFTEGA